MELYEVPTKIVNIMKSMYDGSESCVRVSQGHTDFFNVDSGVRQGDLLSPLLFNIVLDFVMRRIEFAGKGLQLIRARRQRDLAYADDIYLLQRRLCIGSLNRIIVRIKFLNDVSYVRFVTT